MDIKNELISLSKYLWRHLPLSRRTKVLLRHLPRNIKTLLLRIGHSESNQLAAQRLLERRSKTTALINKTGFSKKNSDYKNIDIIVILSNKEDSIAALIENITRSNYSLSMLSLSIIDCRPAADSQEFINEAVNHDQFLLFQLVECKRENLVDKYNFILTTAASEFVLLLNPGYTLEQNTLSVLMDDALNSVVDVACWEAREFPYEQCKVYDPVTGEMNSTALNCSLLRRSALQEVGGYHENFFGYAEEVELSYRLREAGFHLKYVARASVYNNAVIEKSGIQSNYATRVIGNFLLRTRYGLLSDRLVILPLLLLALLKSKAAGSRKKLITHFFKQYIPLRASLLAARKDARDVYFPFYFFDYNLLRLNDFAQHSVPENGPLVSIITRTIKGRSELLIQAGCSVFNQSYPNIEWVVVEDGNITQQKITDLFGSNGNVIYRALDKVGRAEAGNQGMHIASGKWLMFLDDDDCLYADHVETLVYTRLQHPESSASYALAWEVESKIESGGQKISEGKYHQVSSQRQPFNYKLLRSVNYIPIQALLFDATLFAERGGFDPRFDCLEDWHLWQRYSHAKQFTYVPKVTSIYRVPQSIEERSARKKLFVSAYRTVKKDAAQVIDQLKYHTK